MIKKSKVILSSVVMIMLCLGLFAFAAPPATAATILTVNISGNFNQMLNQGILDNYLNQLIRAYHPDQVLIKYPDGTTKKYNPHSTSPVQPQAKPQPKPQPKPSPGNPDSASQAMNTSEQVMLGLVNQERQKAGLQALQANTNLVKLARVKAQEMIDKNYFSHTSPLYGSPFDMMKSAGIKYNYAGENLAGAHSAETAHTNLMNSPGHRANILNASFKEIGIGVVDGGPYKKMFVQMFIG